MGKASHAGWTRIKAIVAEAIELPADSRLAWLDQSCGGDPVFRAEVEALLNAHDQAGTFLVAPALVAPGLAEQVVEAVDSSADKRPPPSRFGAYRVLRQLGRGGMGVVYLGARDDDRFEKHVAIKVVAGDVFHAAVLRRFEDERRILASLDHPNIARLIDAGTTQAGSPYVVMEHVEGKTIDAYCTERRLAVRDRLGLFLKICDAVQYSHQRLVVHRDIKAGNILVTAQGVPKLLDFGIAKLLEPDGIEGSRTRTAMRLLTPESASPEQVRGEPVTVSTDVYSLGVLLYRLLTDRSPYRGAMTTDPEIVRAVCEEEPARPSQHRPDLSRDLDLIALKALRKDPGRRYASVEQLGQDVQRHLDRRPVLAAPDAWTYRARKFVSRHWAGLAAASAVMLAVAVGGAATWWQAQRAERRFNDVRKLARTFMFDVHDAIAPLPGSTAARKLLVTEALAYLDSLAAEAGGDAALQRELASGYEKMADVLGRPSTPNLGDAPGAVAAYRKAQAARERLLADAPDDVELLREMSTTSQKMSRACDITGDNRGGTEEARKATLIEERLSASDRGPAQMFRLGWSYVNHGYLLYVGDETLDSLDRLRKGIDLLEKLNESRWNEKEVQPSLARAYAYQASVLWHGRPVPGRVPDLAGALEAQRRVVALNESLMADATSDTGRQRQLMMGIMSMAQILDRTGDRRRALEGYRQGLGWAERLARADSANLQAQSDYGWTSYELGRLLARDGATAEAFVYLNQSAKLFEPVLAADPSSGYTRAQIAGYQEGFGYAYAALGADRSLLRATRRSHWHEARARFEAARVFWKELRDQGVALGASGAKPDELALEVARCAAAAAELESRP
jgi:non-specific serine/threonine protein kinase/serine/threonine-protein kinase